MLFSNFLRSRFLHFLYLARLCLNFQVLYLYSSRLLSKESARDTLVTIRLSGSATVPIHSVFLGSSDIVRCLEPNYMVFVHPWRSDDLVIYFLEMIFSVLLCTVRLPFPLHRVSWTWLPVSSHVPSLRLFNHCQYFWWHQRTLLDFMFWLRQTLLYLASP